MKIESTFQTTAGTTHELTLTLGECFSIVAGADKLHSWLVAPARSAVTHGTDAKCFLHFGHVGYLSGNTLRMARVSAAELAQLQAVIDSTPPIPLGALTPLYGRLSPAARDAMVRRVQEARNTEAAALREMEAQAALRR